jgi:hypothetical protein
LIRYVKNPVPLIYPQPWEKAGFGKVGVGETKVKGLRIEEGRLWGNGENEGIMRGGKDGKGKKSKVKSKKGTMSTWRNSRVAIR